ncbi:ricin-type beta-trefoil lectin domain protein [Actinoplanes philippinensis]|uniref:ricin-type beta-trefoil lectin domain protein n=1 Tax=Actinoplanes philippinensis TaxID=35752 RepID=UPI0033E9D8D2
MWKSLIAALLVLPAPPAAAPVPIPDPYVFTADDVGFADGGDADTSVGRIAAMDEYLGPKKPILRLDLFWELLQPQRGGPIDWNAGRLDDRVNAAHEQGVRVLLILDYAPSWAGGHEGEHNWLPTGDDDWRTIVTATVEHFGPKVQAYEVWNEPNLKNFGSYGDNSLAQRAGRYWRLVEIAHDVIDARCPDCVVLAGGSAGGDADTTVSPIRNDNEAADWLEHAYTLGKGGTFDAVTYHPYPDIGGGHLPTFSRATCTGTIWYRFWSGFGPDGDPQCGGAAALYDVLRRHGQGDKRIWATEFGFSTLGPREPLAPRYVRDALEEGVRNWRTRSYAGPLFIYAFQSPDPNAEICTRIPGECAFGLRDAAGTPREPMYSDVGVALRGDPWPSTLAPGRSLFRGAALRSPNGKYHLWMQGDGNLVLYEGSRVLWARGGQKAYRLTSQDDGNLVLYDHTRDHTVKAGDAYANPAIWASGTAGKGPGTLRLQDDGNLVLYRDATPLWDTATYTITLTSALGKCLDVPGSDFTRAVRPQTYTCNSTAAQQWIHSDERILTRNNLCLDVLGGATTNGAAIQLETCNGDPAQRWQHTAAGALLNPRSGRCLDIPGSSPDNNVRPQLYTCNTTGAQRWIKAQV